MDAATEPDNLGSALPKEISNRYDVLRSLGQGGMGIVYEAADRETGAKVALKILKPEIAEQAHTIERFKSELLLARKITHKNICRVYDMSRFGGVAVIAMEFVDGESLRARLTRLGQLSIEQSLEIAGQMLDGLDEAHRQGVVHRDLKPENIMIASDGIVKIMDFGLAKAVDADASTTQSGTFTGTPAYMSPEQALGQPAEVRSDIYSFGLILYEMLCGKRAFTGDSAMAIALKQVNETPIAPRQLVPDLPEFVEKAIVRCLEKDRARRFASIAELRTALSRPSLAPAKKSRVPAIGIAAAVILAAAAILAGRGFHSGQAPAQAAAPAVTATPPQQQTASGPSIAILDFANLNKDPQYSNLELGVAEAFTSSFVRGKRFRIVERNQLEKVRAELQLNQTDLVDPATQQKVGRLVGAQYLVVGSFQISGGKIKINARLLRVETGEILQTDSETGKTSDALSLPDSLAERFSSQVK